MNKAKYQYFCTKCGATRDSLLDHPAESGGYSWNCPRCNGPVDSSEVVMTEAPMKIWLDSDGAAWEHYSEEDTPYIRADLVDELVEALEELMYARTDKAEQMAEAALAKLEEQ